MLELLFEKYPKVFIKGKNVLPLKVGISNDILENNPDMSATDLEYAMHYYTNGLQYHKAVTRGQHRYDLNGEIAGVVTDKEKGNARHHVKAIRKNFKKLVIETMGGEEKVEFIKNDLTAIRHAQFMENKRKNKQEK